MSWITYRLSFNPDIQSQLREECQANPLPTELHGNAPLTSEELARFDKLPLLDAVVRETLRLHAPIAETSRQAIQDDVIPVSRPYLDAQGVEHNSIPYVGSTSSGDFLLIVIKGLRKETAFPSLPSLSTVSRNSGVPMHMSGSRNDGWTSLVSPLQPR